MHMSLLLDTGDVLARIADRRAQRDQHRAPASALAVHRCHLTVLRGMGAPEPTVFWAFLAAPPIVFCAPFTVCWAVLPGDLAILRVVPFCSGAPCQAPWLGESGIVLQSVDSETCCLVSAQRDAIEPCCGRYAVWPAALRRSSLLGSHPRYGEAAMRWSVVPVRLPAPVHGRLLAWSLMETALPALTEWRLAQPTHLAQKVSGSGPRYRGPRSLLHAVEIMHMDRGRSAVAPEPSSRSLAARS